MTAPVAPVPLPAGTLLADWGRGGGYVDCFAAEVAGTVTLPRLVAAFYTSRAFRPERWLLGVVLGLRAGDAEALRLARGETACFSAWRVEARRDDQILLADTVQRRTRSWLMVCPVAGGTVVRFGSGVAPGAGLAFTALLGFHRRYSRWLLRGALRQLARQGTAGG